MYNVKMYKICIMYKYLGSDSPGSSLQHRQDQVSADCFNSTVGRYVYPEVILEGTFPQSRPHLEKKELISYYLLCNSSINCEYTSILTLEWL